MEFGLFYEICVPRPWDEVEIRSARGAIPALVIGDDTVPTGVVSMSHAWGRWTRTRRRVP